MAEVKHSVKTKEDPVGPLVFFDKRIGSLLERLFPAESRKPKQPTTEKEHGGWFGGGQG